MADVSDFTVWSSTAASNNPSGGTAVGTGLDDNLRQIQAEVAKWRDGVGYGVLTVTGVAGTANAITGNTSPAPTLAANQKVLLTPTATNTAATTLALNGGAAKNVYAGNSALVGGELHANIPLILQYDGTQFQLLGPVFKQATRQVFTSGSGTYTTPIGATRINIRMVGGGGGGGGTGSSGQGNGLAGGNTTFGTFTANGGSAGSLGNTSTPGNGAAGGGTAGSPNIGISGGSGSGAPSSGSLANQTGGCGGPTAFGGAGGGQFSGDGRAGATNSGGGGAGGGGNTTVYAAGGGGGGGYVEHLIIGPSATYSYGIGAAGTAGAAGTSGQAGGAGGSGILIVDEYFN